jgi:dihydroflavonol-4-reductase
VKVFMTGATGFIGGNLVRLLLNRGYSVKALVREGGDRRNISGLDIEVVPGDLRDSNLDLKQTMRGCEAVFHVAASYSFWTPDKQSVIEANIGGTRRVLESALKAGVPRVVFTSSESTVAASKKSSGTEDGVIALHKLHGPYKQSKLQSETIALGMWREKELPVVVVNPTMPIGCFDIKPTPTGQVVVDYLNRKMPAYVNSGMNVVDVEDVAAGHILAMEKGRPGERYILGNRNVSFREMLQILEQVSGLNAPRFSMPIWVALSAACADELVTGRILGKCPRVQLAAVQAASKYRYHDCTRAVHELGMPQSSVEAAFARAVRWFRENGYVNRN